MSLLRSSLQEINEILLQAGTYTMSIPDSTQEQVETIDHNYGKAPFYTYTISFDNSKFIPWPNGQTTNNNENLKDLYLYTDDTKVYFHYLYASSSGLPGAFSIYIRYKLYLTEAAE